MITISNSLSFFRAPLAFLLLQESVALRLFAIALAMLTDSIDGYLARRNRSTSRFGAILDPAMDKFFVYVALSIFLFEGRISSVEICCMLSRDLSLVLYGLAMILRGKYREMEFRAIRWGKITTALQFIVLIGLSLQINFSWIIYSSFVVMGFLAFLELVQTNNPFSCSQQADTTQ